MSRKEARNGEGSIDWVNGIATVSAIIGALLLAGCANELSELPTVHGSDGKTYQELTCSDHTSCLEEMGERCPHGYVVNDDSTDEGRTVVAHVGSVWVAKHHSEETVLFRCKVPKSRSDYNE